MPMIALSWLGRKPCRRGRFDKLPQETLGVLQELRDSGDKVTGTIARGEARDRLANSKAGNVVESLIERQLDSTSDC